MTCCDNSMPGPAPTGGVLVTLPLHERRQTNEAMCLCRHAKDGRCRHPRAEGWPIVTLTAASRCPLGRHADALGRVRWLGVLWYGVPKPLRRGRELPGCGCPCLTRDLWNALLAGMARRGAIHAP